VRARSRRRGRASGKTFPDYNPATGTILAQVAEAEAEDVDRAVKAARRAHEIQCPKFSCASDLVAPQGFATLYRTL
jgi:acyl-CoA reductase-like NAD-dependent aldehyde dehydrogenase